MYNATKVLTRRLGNKLEQTKPFVVSISTLKGRLSEPGRAWCQQIIKASAKYKGRPLLFPVYSCCLTFTLRTSPSLANMQLKSLACLLLGQSALVAAQSATSTSTQATATCEPHEDHWHCPSGVPQPTLNPDGSPNPKADHGDDDHDHGHDHSHDQDHDHDHDHDAASPTATTASNGCTPHGDHWHCPSGVPKPTTPPPGYTPTGSAASSAASSSASVSPTSPATGAAGRAGSLAFAVVVGSSLLLGALLL